MISAQTDITENKKIEQRNKLLVEENNEKQTSKLIKLKTYIAF
jgi:hypothetical protein